MIKKKIIDTQGHCDRTVDDFNLFFITKMCSGHQVNNIIMTSIIIIQIVLNTNITEWTVAPYY